jgi:hypothetical protein
VDILELFPLLAPNVRAHGDSCAKPIGRRAAGRGRRAPSGPRKSAAVAGQLIELRRLIEQQHAELMVELRTLRQVRRIEYESLPAVLRRVTEIERHLRLVETPAMPRITRRRPLD